MAGVGGVDVVPDPMDGGGACGGTIQRGLEMHEGGAVFFGKACDDFLTLDDVGIG